MSDNSNSSKERGDPLEIFYPPFFPMGNTQGIYSVLNQEDKDSSSVDSTEKQNAELVAAQQQEQIVLDDKENINKTTAESKQVISPGSVLDLKV
ncbi:MAG TPA: hypothetical protein PKW50_10580 [Syntrophomonas sp.]|nr:hypothetical protein [Syntrophomonas sp.]